MTPQKDAGCRTEPPVSDPRAARHMPVATATADPPDEPPGDPQSIAISTVQELQNIKYNLSGNYCLTNDIGP